MQRFGPCPDPADPAARIFTRADYEDDEEQYECSEVLSEHSQDVKAVQWHPHRDVGGFCPCACLGIGLNQRAGHLLSVNTPLPPQPSTWDLQILASVSYDNTVVFYHQVVEEQAWHSFDKLSQHTSTVWCIAFDATGERCGGLLTQGTRLKFVKQQSHARCYSCGSVHSHGQCRQNPHRVAVL